MESGATHPIRISKPGTSRVSRSVRLVAHPKAPEEPAPEPVRLLRNRAGTQRARRIAVAYIVAIALVFLALGLLARTAPAAGTSGAGQDLELAGGVALALAVLGALVSLTSAPVAVERTGGETIVHGLFGYRRRFREGPGFSVRVVRRFPAGLLSVEEVESVELASKGVRRTYLLEVGLVPETVPAPPSG